MENVSRNFGPQNLNLFRFDLKGSVINRRSQLIKGKILKCQNFVDLNSSKKKIVRLDLDQIEELHEIIDRDAYFLKQQRLLDYSLLLVVE